MSFSILKIGMLEMPKIAMLSTRIHNPFFNHRGHLHLPFQKIHIYQPNKKTCALATKINALNSFADSADYLVPNRSIEIPKFISC
jgi:hypothetical protein